MMKGFQIRISLIEGLIDSGEGDWTDSIQMIGQITEFVLRPDNNNNTCN